MNASSFITQALWMSFTMVWEIFWALVLGFLISAIVQALVPKGVINKALPDSSLASLWRATWLGAASSSCSYAAVAITRSLIAKGANNTAAFVFEFASTNLVVELGIILWLLLGWQFALAEYLGGMIMIILLSGMLHYLVTPVLAEEAREQASKGVVGHMEGHKQHGRGITAVSHYFVMDVAMMGKEIGIGLLVAGAIAAWVPYTFWGSFFMQGTTGFLPVLWGALVGPLIAVLSFVCSIGNVPLAAVLWGGGMSFSGVVSFMFADLLILPILAIYRKYYGPRMTLVIALSSYLAMVGAGLLVEGIFSWLHLIPIVRTIVSVPASITLNYTFYLNILALIIVSIIGYAYLRTGGPKMMRTMHSSEHHHHH